jgi:hypothetical protein
MFLYSAMRTCDAKKDSRVMAHIYVHIAIGMLTGAGMALILGMKLKTPVLSICSIRRLIILTYALGLYAAIPSFAHELNLIESPETILNNIFILHPVISQSLPGNMLKAQCLICGIIAVEYGLVLLAIRNKKIRYRLAG